MGEHWEIAALLREAEQVRNDAQLDDAERRSRLAHIAGEIRTRGGDAAMVIENAAPRTVRARATRTSKTVAARRKA